ncbi:MAG: hypothetical protein OHK0019_02500 [Saprospiraceae bacterium]
MIQNYPTTRCETSAKISFSPCSIFTGLAVGLACCILIALYIFEETHYDRHHERASDLYRVDTTFIKLQSGEGEERPTLNTPAPLGAVLQREFPEIEMTARTAMAAPSGSRATSTFR